LSGPWRMITGFGNSFPSGPRPRLGGGVFFVKVNVLVDSCGVRVQGSGFRVQGSGFGVQGSGFRKWDAGYRVSRGEWADHIGCWVWCRRLEFGV